MPHLYSYILKNDTGAAPNPFWGICTLTICKPDIRRTAQIGDWVLGTGSKNAKLSDGNIHNLSNFLVYAMKITEKMTLKEYDEFCRNSLPDKLPIWGDSNWIRRMGDCIYDYSGKTKLPNIRDSVHTIDHRERDLRGISSLHSNHYYYFGSEPRKIPESLKILIRKGRKHLVTDDLTLIKRFEKWIKQFHKNKIYAEPQLKSQYSDGDGTGCDPDNDLLSCNSPKKKIKTNCD